MPPGGGDSQAPLAPARPRERLEPAELARVCAAYDLGAIRSVRDYPRGSSRAPKAIIETDRATYLLKRRAVAAATPARVALAHAVQSHLASRGFPLPRLVPPRRPGGSGGAVEQHGHVYEMFEYVPGSGFDGTAASAEEAGRLLARFHRALRDLDTRALKPPAASYHNAAGIAHHLDRIARAVPEAAPAMDVLAPAYAHAAERVRSLGFATWPVHLTHGDWHPGNLVFRGGGVAAVIDFDTVRLAPRVVDAANGALQFSIARPAEHPSRWPPGLDRPRLSAFIAGYESEKKSVLSAAELDAVPWLMTEALIAEAAGPIAATGDFGGLDAAAVLRMVADKVRWISDHAARLIDPDAP